jgi:hypothetical protein
LFLKMKNIFKYKTGLLLLLTAAFSAGCDDYLDQTPEATITEDYLFSDYKGFQGFIDGCYTYVMDYTLYNEGSNILFGDEALTNNNHIGPYIAATGNYWSLTNYHRWAPFNTGQEEYFGNKGRGFWTGSWFGIRHANLALEKLPLLTNATQEQKDKIAGQAYFFRAFLYYEIARSYGGMPYVDKYLTATDEMKLPRLNFQQTAEKIVADFDKAAQLLPESWANGTDTHEVGRVTKGTALAFKAKTLLYAGSPLMVHESTGKGYEFDAEYMKRCAAAAYEVIKLADKGVYKLLPLSKGSKGGNEFNDQFGRNDGYQCYTEETIFMKFHDADYSWMAKGVDLWAGIVQRNFIPQRWGSGNGHPVNDTPTQNLVDMFEMKATGLPITDPQSGFDPMHPWEGRDPRLRNGILVDRDVWSVLQPETYTYQSYIGGLDRNANQPTPYDYKKCFPKTCNKADNQFTNYRGTTPQMRLAEVYLMYAEAMNEAYGPIATAAGLPLSARDAINIVRRRPLSADNPSEPIMPDVDAKFLTGKEVFRERIWNEEEVELFFEGNRWFDLRRWHVAHLDKYKVIYGLDFDKDWTYFNKTVVTTKVFEERHYWMPIPIEQTQLYKEFPQNPGW